MFTVRRSIQGALVSLLALGVLACGKDSVTGVPVGRRVAGDPILPDPPVYSSNFSAAIGAEWSGTHLGTTTAPDTAVTFLGEFSNDTATLTVAVTPTPGVTPDTILLSVDIYVLRSWDGVDPGAIANGWGPDGFEILANGATVTNTTFGNNDQIQNFPDIAGGTTTTRAALAANPDWAPYVSFNRLGYKYWIDLVPCDAIYQAQYAFPFTTTTLTLKFLGKGLQDISDESWGINNVQVSIIHALNTFQTTASTTGTVGVPLTFTPVTATGGVTPYSFALTGGSLPTGMSFDPGTGQITGNPSTTLSQTTFTVTVTDSSTLADNVTQNHAVSSKTFTLTVN